MRPLSRRRALGLALTLAAVTLSGCNPFGRTYTYRYRITVEVDTPQGLRTGSSVWESWGQEGTVLDGTMGVDYRGEAVAVDLPTGTLFALLRDPKMGYNYPAGVVDSQFKATFNVQVDPQDGWKDLSRQIARSRATMTLEPRFYPALVRFRDTNDPASVEIVHPSNLAASFGPGVRLRRITVTVTDDGVTTGIEKRLPWLEPLGRERGTIIPNPPRFLDEYTPAQRITPRDFSTEIYR